MSFSRSVLGFTAVTSPRPLLASSSSPWTCPNRPVGTLSPAHHRAAKLRSPNAFPICCNASAVGKEDPDGDVLDEKAMRAAEIHEVLDGLQEFRQRIIDDATKLAKKVRASKKDLQRSLDKHPDILKIDGHVKDLQEELQQLGDR